MNNDKKNILTSQDNMLKKKTTKNIFFSILPKNRIVNIFKNYFTNTKNIFTEKIKNIFFKKKIDKNFFKKLEKTLLLSDFGTDIVEKIIYKFKKKINIFKVVESEKAILILKKQLLKMIYKTKQLTLFDKNINLPLIILVVGVNGVGKTTTIAKLAYFYKKKGKSVILSAGDTFRAAAVDQLKELGKKYDIPVIAKKLGTDPASVVFDSIQKAKKNKSDILIIDTAGRLHNKNNLIRELQKIFRVIKKFSTFFIYETILVIDVCIGQNAIKQAHIFGSNINITSIILTKLDGTAKGGIIFSIVDRFMIPVSFITTGEKITDLKIFDGKLFVEEIFKI